MSKHSGKIWMPEEDAQLRDLAASGARPAEVAKKLHRTKGAIMTRAYELRVTFGRAEKPPIVKKKAYIFDHYLFTSRRGTLPPAWFWEIRRKSDPDQRSVSVGGFKSAKAAEEAGRVVLTQIREHIAEERHQNPIDKKQERLSKIAKKSLEAAIAKARKKPLTPDRRSELARSAAHARAQVLTAERRKEIGRMGGAASKAKSKIKKNQGTTSDSEGGVDE
jgi:hypothetical protein